MNQGTIGGYWPLYEDGTPVRIGDTVDGHEGHYAPMVVKCVKVVGDATVIADGVWSTVIMPGKRLKRYGDAPEGTPCLCGSPDGDVETAHVPSDEPNWHLVIDGVRYGVSNHARRAIAEALDLCTSKRRLPSGIEWPEVDGEPVVPGDVLWDAGTGRRVAVDRVGFDQDGTVLVAGDGEEIRAAGIDGIAYPAGAVSLDDLTRTEPKPVLDRDGVPIEAGDVVWDDNSINWLVTDTRRHRGGYIVAVTARGAATERKPESLTHKRPDSWERLAEDATKAVFDYWSCRDVDHDGCPAKCPAKVDGKDPRQRYGTDKCFIAMRADIVARAKALAGVTGDE